MDDSMNGRDSRAIEGLIQLLPNRFQPALSALALQSRGNGAGEAELFGELRRCLNLCVTEGLLDRRAFLRIGSLLVSAGLLSAIFPQSAAAAGPMMPFAFWKQRTAPGSGSSGYPVNTGSDPYWDYVVLLMNMDTASGIPTTVFADESNVGKTPMISGSPYIDTAASSSPYTGRAGSGKFNGTTDYLYFGDSPDWCFLAQDFTVELFVRFSSVSSDQTIISQDANPSGASRGWGIQTNGTMTNLQFYFSTNGSSASFVEFAWTPSVSTWYHLVISRSGTSLKAFVNGSQIGSTYDIGAATLFDSTKYLMVGAYSTSTHFLNGSIADLRIYKGIAKYTANFTPRTTPIGLGTANDKYWGYCVLACPFENSLKDMSGKSATLAGSPSLSSSIKKYGSASCSFNGSSSLLYSSSEDFGLGSQNFTIEFWLYYATLPGTLQDILDFRSSNTASAIVLAVSSSNKIYYYDGPAGTTPTAATALSAQTFYHIAFVRNGSQLQLFVNGSVVASSTTSSDFGLNQPLRIGVHVTDTVNYLTGYIDSLRITKGVARYTSDFTPPTASFPVGKDETADPFWNYTTLLLPLAEAAGNTVFMDQTSRHTVTGNGSAATSSSSKKWAATSGYFPASTATVEDVSDFDQVGDFTHEAWLNYVSGSNFYLFMKNVAGYCLIRYYPDNASERLMAVTHAGSNIIVTGVALPTGWSHIAMTRQGSVVRLFLNGVLLGSATYSTNTSGNANGTINYLGATVYLQDLRITKGIARYVQNFTPPTRAFATSDALAGDPFWSQTMLLMTMDDFIDSTGRHTLTNNNSVTTSTSGYKFGTGSASYNGTSSFLSKSGHSDFQFPNDFTVEGWLKLSGSNSNSAGIFVQADSGSGWQGWQVLLSSNKILIEANSVGGAVGTTNINDGQWHHIAMVRSGSTITGYVDGTPETSFSTSANISSNSTFVIGRERTGAIYFYGSIDDLRITKGVARYTASFDPPSRALPSLAGAADVTSSIVTSGLVCYLDAGDGRSFAGGSAQKWRNMTTSPADGSSQNAYDFFLGASSSSESTDPTFVGVSGGRSANDYFSFDGGDYFTLAGGHTSFVNSLHKDGAKFTLVCVVRTPSSFGGSVYGARLFSTGSNYGFDLMWIKDTRKVRIIANGSSFTKDSDVALLPSTTYFLAVSLDETASGFLYLNGRYAQVGGADNFSAAYSSPTTTDPDGTLRIGNAGVVHSEVYVENSTQIHLLQLYNRALTKAELDQNFNAMRSRFGI